MKAIENITIKICACVLLILYSCEDDFLDRAPLSTITPDNYLTEESQLGSYAIARYGFSVFGTFSGDNHTDTQAARGYSNMYIPGQLRVGQTGGAWSFNDIYQCNYFLQKVLPRWKAGKISGNVDNINHYIGEMYFFRAWAYFGKLQTLGDFPIIKSVLPDDKELLITASQRAPRTDVARFIISDLDSAIMLMKSVAPDGKKNRLSKACAQLVKSRVALHEATWLKYFQGTAFVPNGPGWPGKEKSYNASYNFTSGSIESEIDYFLTEAMDASKAVANSVPLVANSMTLQQQTTNHAFAVACDANPYLRMFSQVDLSSFSEVLLWRKYDQGLGVTNSFPFNIQQGGLGIGFTRGFVDGFLMANGLPIYAPGSGYAGDDSIGSVRKNRDGRCWLFLAEPGQESILYFNPLGTHSVPIVIIPDIMNLLGNRDQPTGYVSSKGNNYDQLQGAQYLGSFVGSIVFRAAEAYLNYMEACYEKTGNLDATAQLYWQQIRARAGVSTDFQKTIDATDVSIEAQNDWSAYSAGQLVDKTLYNIRRERRCELIGEGRRDADLRRWRAMDIMITTPYFIEGFKLWGPMKDWYKASDLTYSVGDNSRVSDPALSLYLRPYQKTTTSLAFNGYKWAMAHYLNPISVQHFLITSPDGVDVTQSPIYQNPGWPITASMPPTGY